MARPLTPTSIMELKNAFKKNPQRKRESAPEPRAVFIPDPPKHLTDTQRNTWCEIVKIVPEGVLADADAIHVELCACLLSEFRVSKGTMDTTRITRLEALLGKLGLNPSARAGMSIKGPRKRNKYDDV